MIPTGGSPGPTKQIHMSKGTRGVIDFRLTSHGTGATGSAVTLRLQGRLSKEQDFVDVFLTDIADHCEVNSGIPGLTFEDVQLFPEMRVLITANDFISATIQSFLGH
ncbi:MAG: hypothetical protein Unbinned1446contig1001_25 [Prokaryotic dsDNA virus sp.]|nr:MAG: hypothetical protein Unbinned1446contig1001_25 [Prokaryotic dsDNA virus sp.]